MHLRRIASLCLAVSAVALNGCHRAPTQESAATPAAKKPFKEPEVPLGPPLETADIAAQKIFQGSASTGMVITIVRGTETWSRGYGRVAPGSNETPSATSLLRLCSITKILATDILAKLVADKTVSLDDPLQKFAPENVTVPQRTVRGPAERPIELEDLATHTAGMPREIAYPPAGMAHFTFPDFDYRWKWLPDFRLRGTPGNAAHYSNIGFDLLADALSKASGEPYAALFHERTAVPVGMVDTTLSPTPEQCTRLMSGAREPSECTDTQAAGGSGGMYSTATDMARFMRYLLSLPGVPVHQDGTSTQIVLDPAKLHSIQGISHGGVPPTGLGLGWIEIYGDHGEARIVEKTGGGAGFGTYIALLPARHTGIFVAMTEGRHNGGTSLFRESNDLLLTMAGLTPITYDDASAEDAEEARPAKAAPHGRATHAVAASRKQHAIVAKPHAAGKKAATVAPKRSQTVKRRVAMKPSSTAHKPHSSR